MRSFLFLMVGLFITACSSKQYTYRFPVSHDLVVEKKKNNPALETFLISEQPTLMASRNPEAALVLPRPDPQPKKIKKDTPSAKQVVKSIKNSARHLKEEVQNFVSPNPDSLDEDLKMAILFGVVGVVSLVLLILSKLFGIIGGISLIIATVYFVKWFLAQ